MGNRKYIPLLSPEGGETVRLEVDASPGGIYKVVKNLLQAMTDQQAASVVLDGALQTDSLLAGGISVDMNTLAVTGLYTVPATANGCILTKVVVRNPSVSLTLAAYAFGFKSPNFADAIASAAHTGLNATNAAILLLATATGFTIGAAGDVFSVKVNTQQGAPATAIVDVHGYLF